MDKPEYAQLVLMHIESRVRHLAKCQQRKPVYVECLDISSAPNRCVCVTQRSLDDLGSVAVAVSNHELGTDE